MEDNAASRSGPEGAQGSQAESGGGEGPTAAAPALPLEHQRQAVFPWISGTCLCCKELRIRCCGVFPCRR